MKSSMTWRLSITNWSQLVSIGYSDQKKFEICSYGEGQSGIASTNISEKGLSKPEIELEVANREHIVLLPIGIINSLQITTGRPSTQLSNCPQENIDISQSSMNNFNLAMASFQIAETISFLSLL
ncbi:hypothetical protein MERGE_001292 [Pneumocystis wakefieldiae]|uniref:Uncharacterized protein n=1 Tax=Pneumocystis wakefieldiae TaxID=38082 RepID=A0A899G2P3_9ASCO|nr:hypothetical protein MERGE_001292 [Pneumocystis wakefieldiae]